MANGFQNVPPLPQELGDNVVGGNLSGIFSTRPQAKYMSGARCVIRINGRPAMFAFGIAWRITTSFRELNTIDSPLPDDLIPKNIQVEGSISTLHVPGKGPGVMLWQADMLSFLFHQYIQIEVRDSRTNELLFYAPKAVITSRQEDIRVDQLANISLSFRALGFRDERSPKVPEAVDTRSPADKNSSTSSTGDRTTAPILSKNNSFF